MNIDIYLEIFSHLNIQFVKTKLSLVDKKFDKIISSIKFTHVNLDDFRNDVDITRLSDILSLDLGKIVSTKDQDIKDLTNLTNLNLG